MVGNKLDAHILAGRLGIRTFWLNRHLGVSLPSIACRGQGNLPDLVQLVQTGRIDEL